MSVDTGQRYLIWKACSEQSEAWRAKHQRILDEANRKRSEAQSGIPKAEINERAPASSGQTLPKQNSTNATAVAKAIASNTNRGAVERMDHLSRARPDLAEQVKAGELPGTAAMPPS